MTHFKTILETMKADALNYWNRLSKGRKITLNDIVTRKWARESGLFKELTLEERVNLVRGTHISFFEKL